MKRAQYAVKCDLDLTPVKWLDDIRAITGVKRVWLDLTRALFPDQNFATLHVEATSQRALDRARKALQPHLFFMDKT